MPSDKISVLLAGSEQDLSDNLQEVLGHEGWIDVVGASNSEKRLIELAKKLSPEVIVMDLGFAGDGLKTSQQLLKASPESKIIVLSIYDYVGRVDVQTVPEENLAALDSIEWLSKNSQPAEVLASLSDKKNKPKKRRIQ